MAPWDRELALGFAHLRARGFVPPPIRELPAASAAARTFASWQPEDRAALAAELVTLPEPAEAGQLGQTDRAWAALELLLRVPGEAERARQLIGKLEARLDPRGSSEARSKLAVARFRAAALAGVELGRRIAELRGAADATALGEGLRRAAVEALDAAPRGKEPYGHAWLASVCDGTEIANLTLAFARRPALGRELERIADWTAQAGPGPALAAAEAADAAGDFARGTELLTLALTQHGTSDDVERALAARRLLLADGERRDFPAPERAAPEPIRAGWETRLLVLGTAAPDADVGDVAPSPEDLALLEAIGEYARAGRGWLARREPHALRFADLLAPTELGAAFGKAPDDELTIAKDPRPALAAYQVLPPGPAKQLLALRMVGAHVTAADEAPAEAPAPFVSDDPHHPDNRLAAASDLLAAGQTAAGATVLAALIRKADATSNRRLFEVVAQALEAEDPELELVTAAQRVLADDQRAPLLLAALHGNPTAAYALHEALLAAALDASRRDRDRLLALETWLRIWTATGTAPDPASIQTLRRDEPTLLAVAAVRIGSRGGRSGTPLADAMTFLAAHPPAVTAPDVFSDGLLALAQ